VGHKLSRGTIANILKDNGIEPAFERAKRTPWRTFLRAHWDVLAAADFFTVEVARPTGLVTYYIFFVIELSTRRIHIAGISPTPDSRFILQVGRGLTDAFDGFLLDKRFLILDRDTKFTDEFRELLVGSGTNVVRLPARSPNLNAYAERFVLSIKSECLDRLIFFTEASLRRAVRAFADHYHRERCHQGLGNTLIEPATRESGGEIQSRDRLGGMLRYYYRQVA
jgi:transposase InsO family protein